MTQPTHDPRPTDRPPDPLPDVDTYPAADAAHPASGHGRSAATAHAAPAHGATTAAHGAHGEADEEALGPVDVELWGAGVLATVIGLFMAICFVLATAGTGAY